MLIRPYEMPWRPAYELWAAAAWAAGLCYFVYLGGKGLLTVSLALALAFLALLMAGHRLRQGLNVLTVRSSLSGKAMQVISTRRLEALTRDPSQVFLGFGFEWLPVHSQRLYELAKIDYKDYAASPAVLRLLGYAVNPQPDSEIGLPFIHGVEPREKALYRPLQNFEGGTLLVGTTQAGKGVALGSFLTQAIRRGDVVVFIDPKNSRRLKRVVQRACSDYRDADTFLEFHPAFPELGVRLDFTFNWQKPTEIASRIQSVMPVDTGGAFTAFGWDAVNVVVQGLVSLEDRPNLLKLTKYIEGGIEPVLEASLQRLFDGCLGPAWRDLQEMRALMQSAVRGQIKRPSEVATPQLMACVSYYEQHMPQSRRDKVIDSQIRVFRHNREHYQKITANLLPILSMLTSGDLGGSLSPDPFDLADKRPIMNFEKIERGGHVLYMCLDSLPDPSVASAIGALAIADLAARAGMRYNLGITRRITLVVDEIANVINQPLIEILNKGAEGGIHSICAMQTLADLAKRLGSEDAARMALGNLNNLFALRSKDRPTQDFIVETFGKTGIHTMRVGINQGADTHIGDWSAGKSVQLTESMEERVPVDILGKLPNLQYFGSVAGRLVKGRFPILDPDFDRPKANLKDADVKGGRVMLRYVWIGAMLAILCIVLYIPSASPPERFTEVLRAEHAASRDLWGPVVADRILRRMLDIQQGTPAVSDPPPQTVQVGQQAAVDAAMAAQVTQMSLRLFGNPYFRSIDSLFALATYRLSAIIELLPLLAVFLLVVAVDGFVLRQIRAKEFVAHSAEMFGGSLIVAIVLGSTVAVSAFLPISLHPMFVTLSLLAMLFALSRAIANYHVIR